MESVAVQEVSPAQAVAAMRAAGLRAPLACDTPEGIARHGHCLKFETGQGACVFVVRQKGAVLWIDGAAAVDGQGLTAAGLELAEAVARQTGAREIAFETGRAGLVRLSKRAGYEVAGYVMKKAVQ